MPFTTAPTRVRTKLPPDLPSAHVAQTQGHESGAAYLSEVQHGGDGKLYRLVHATWRLDPKHAPPKPVPAPVAAAPVAARK